MIMGGLYSHQKVVKRRYLTHINIWRSVMVRRRLSTLGSGIIKFFALAAVFVLVSFKKIFSAVRQLFLRLVEMIRFNPMIGRVTVVSCLTGFFASAVFLVLFAVVSPELPPENLISTMKDISEVSGKSDNAISQVKLQSDDDWASLTFFDGAELETGAGSQIWDRSKDFEYPVRPGETLSEIAYSYDIPYDFLAWYNKIGNANRIRVGTVLTIPSLDNMKARESEYAQQKTKQRQNQAAARAVRNIEITSENHNNGAGLGITVHFSIKNPPSDLKSYEWDLGDGRRSFRESPSHEYSQPRTYAVRLTAQDSSGNIFRSSPLYIDIPHPASQAEHSTTRFATLSSMDDYFVVNGTITKIARYANIEDILDLSESDQVLTKARFKKSGYFGVTVMERGREQYYSVFVSPIPTMHVDMAMSNFNWYRTQFNTGTASNCGPAAAAMGISWGAGGYFPVSSVRQAVGWQGDGGTSFDELIKVIRGQGVAANLQHLRTTQDVINVIDSGSIAIILFLTDGVRTARRDPATDLFGKYYNDSVGHYVVVKGYSLSGEYFVIHDPIPSDWGGNSFRYADEISMMGRNRYFPASEVIRSLRRNEMIVVPGMY